MSLITHAPLVSTRRILQKLGVPDDVRPSTAWLDLVAGAADWYAAHGRPWRTVEELAVMRIEPDRVHLDPTATLNSAVLARGFATADVSAVQLVAVSAGDQQRLGFASADAGGQQRQPLHLAEHLQRTTGGSCAIDDGREIAHGDGHACDPNHSANETIGPKTGKKTSPSVLPVPDPPSYPCSRNEEP